MTGISVFLVVLAIRPFDIDILHLWHQMQQFHVVFFKFKLLGTSTSGLVDLIITTHRHLLKSHFPDSVRHRELAEQ